MAQTTALFDPELTSLLDLERTALLDLERVFDGPIERGMSPMAMPLAAALKGAEVGCAQRDRGAQSVCLANYPSLLDYSTII